MSGTTLGIDLGTSGVRAILADGMAPGAGAAVAIAPEHRRDPARLWAAVETVLEHLKDRLGAVRALSVDGTSGTILPVDAAGEPLGPLSVYNDRAEEAHGAAVAALMPAESAAGGATSPLARALGFPPGARLLHEADWIAFRLGAAFGTSDANNALKTGYDPRIGAWPNWLAGLPVPLLPHVVEPGTAIGEVSAAGRRLGLPAGTIVAAGTTDGCASFLATGAARPGDAVSALGSTLTVKLLSDQPIFAPAYGIYSHRLFGAWLAGGASNSGGAVLAQFFDAAALERLSAAIDPSRPSPFDYRPLPRPGERFPVNDPTLAPCMTPRPADDAAFLHGLLEGIARIEAAGYARLHALGGPPVARVLTVGRGASNRSWTAIRARVLGVPVEPVPGREAAFGAALLARSSLE